MDFSVIMDKPKDRMSPLDIDVLKDYLKELVQLSPDDQFNQIVKDENILFKLFDIEDLSFFIFQKLDENVIYKILDKYKYQLYKSNIEDMLMSIKSNDLRRDFVFNNISFLDENVVSYTNFINNNDIKYLLDNNLIKNTDNLYKALESIDSEDRIVYFEKYADSLKTYNLFDIIKRLPLRQKLAYYQKYEDRIPDYFIYDYVRNIIDFDLKEKKIIQYIDKLLKLENGYLIGELIESFPYSYAKRLLNTFKDSLNSLMIVKIIRSFPDPAKREIFQKEFDKISKDSSAVYEYIKSFDSDIKNKMIVEYQDYLNDLSLYDFIKKLPDDIKFEYIRKLDKNLDKETIKRIFFETHNSNLKEEILKNYFYVFSTILSNRLKELNVNDENLFKKYSDLEKNQFLLILDFQEKNINQFDSIEKFNKTFDYILKINNSNSSEIRHINNQIMNILFAYPIDEWENMFERIENIFLKNNLPYVGKIFKVFDIMYPQAYVKNTKSPNLNHYKSINSRKVIIFTDLLKCSLGSNNRSIIEYIKNIYSGNDLLKSLINGSLNINQFTDEQKEIFTIYVMHLNTLYNNTIQGKQNPRNLSGNIVKDSYELLTLFLKNEHKEFNADELPNRIVKMFSHFAGINTIDEMRDYIKNRISSIDDRNRQRALNNDLTIKKGDYYKGLANVGEKLDIDLFYSYLIDILQNGSVCKEFLGSQASTDLTPLDSDLSRIERDVDDFSKPFKDSLFQASSYGPLWLVLKDDDKFVYTNEDSSYNSEKLEIFQVGMVGHGHYGVRTGFSSSDIDYFVIDEEKVKLYRIEYAIVMNGFYIPVLNTSGKLLFTPEKYDELRKDIQGLKHFNTDNRYDFAEELKDFNIDDEKYNISVDKNIEESSRKRNLVINELSSTGLNISNKREIYINNGMFELLDTGSTGRGTNSNKDYDFDFILRVDRDVFLNEKKMEELRNNIKSAFPSIKFESNTTIRNQILNINNEDIKIDITIIPKDDKIEYTTDECIVDRLSTIKKINPDMHKKVLENIILAKEVLKEGHVYKPKHSQKNEGGLGGVGVENWILQNGGSFERAARSFVEVSEKCKNFAEFKERYIIYDFGENHMYKRHSDNYKHDEFISNNMDDLGYIKMVNVLKEYINDLNNRKKEGKHL